MDDVALPFAVGFLAIIIALAGIVTPGDYSRYGLLLTGNLADRPTYGTLDRWYYANDTEELFYDNSTAWIEIPLGGAGSDYDIYGKVKTGTHASRPSASIIDRWYYETDTQDMFYDNGTAWFRIEYVNSTTFTGHTHTESDITDLEHDAIKIKGVTVDDASIADGLILKYNSTSGNLEYEVDEEGEGGGGADKGLLHQSYGYHAYTYSMGTRYIGIGGTTNSATEDERKQPFPACTLKKLYVYCFTNSMNGIVTISVRVNKADPASKQSVTIPAGTTGLYTSAVDMSVSDSDYVNLKLTESASSGLMYIITMELLEF